jgi:hypothetical protein
MEGLGAGVEVTQRMSVLGRMGSVCATICLPSKGATAEQGRELRRNSALTCTFEGAPRASQAGELRSAPAARAQRCASRSGLGERPQLDLPHRAGA